jgi:site-specific recombinase XerD
MTTETIAPPRALTPARRATTSTSLAVLDAEIAAEDVAAAVRFAENAKAKNTHLAYASDWRGFTAWARERGRSPLPCSPGLLCAYVASRAESGLRASSLQRHVAAIAYYHRAAGYDAPGANAAVREVMRGIRHTLGTAPRVKTPLTADLVMRMIAACPKTMIGVRDRALIALGFAGAFRRSELVALDMADLTETGDGLRVLIRRSKTDQSGEGQEVAIPHGFMLKPVELLQMWFSAAGISAGPVFRQVNKGGKVSDVPLGDDGYIRCIKRRCAAVGLDAAEFAGHSLRSGFLTSASESGADLIKMAEVSRHRSMDVLRRYVRRSNLFKAHAGAAFL